MKKVLLSVVAALACSMAPALAADLPAKAVKAPAAAPAVSPWDIAFGAAVVSDYNFRGISQSAKKPSFWAYVEPRYNINANLQLYVGTSFESIRFPNNDRSEIDLYGGIRPTVGPVAFDFGYWYYYYPGGTTFNGLGTAATCTNGVFSPNGSLTCNVMKAKMDFWEVYGKATWTVNDALAIGGNLFYSPSWLNSGAPGTYGSVTGKVTAPSAWFPADWGMYVSAELGRYWIGTSDAFYGVPAFPAGIDFPDYTTWNIGLAITYKVVTLDLRWYDTNLSKANCNVLTGDHTATYGGVAATSTLNPSGFVSNWCGSTFIAKLAIDFTAANFK